MLDSLQKSDDMQATVTKIENFIKNHGGNILNREEWGKKRLAYEINRKQYGNYIHFLFEAPSDLPGLLEREYRLEEAILRYLTVKADPRNYPEEKAEETRPAAPPAAETTETDAGAEPTSEPSAESTEPKEEQPAADTVESEESGEKKEE